MIETIGTFMNIIHTILARDWYCAEYVWWYVVHFTGLLYFPWTQKKPLNWLWCACSVCITGHNYYCLFRSLYTVLFVK